MTNQSGNLPGTTAPQAQLARLRKRLLTLATQLERLNNKAESSKDGQLKSLLARATANAATASSLSDAVDTIGSQTALDLLVTTNNDVQINVAVTAFEDVPDTNNLKPLAKSMEPVVLQDETTSDPTDDHAGCQPKRFSCCSPDPDKWFEDGNSQTKGTGPDSMGNANSDGTNSAGNNTCEQPSYLMLTVPVSINTRTERVDEFLRLGDSLVAAAQAQLGQAREALCHASGEDTCSLF
jgi:hypothetical protein